MDSNAQIIEQFRVNNGVVRGIFEGFPLVLLHTTGARSGKQRVTPLVPLVDGESMFVFASAAGAPNNPDWYHNLVENPQVTVELGIECFTATAVVIDGPARDRIVAKQIELYPNFVDYQTHTTRTIPVVELRPTGHAGTHYYHRRTHGG
jgi:deazaflavin-dependent oxidoreductase (nitroreductase family)